MSRYEYVKNYFFTQNCELLELTYKNNKQKLKYKCSCGNISYIRFDNFLNGSRCNECGRNKTINSKKLSHKYVSDFFISNNCLLLDIYTKSNIPVKYKCECGNISKITFNSFKKGQRCKQCGINKRIGDKNPNWNPNKNHNINLIEIHQKSIKYKKRYKKMYNCTDSHIHVDHIFPINVFVEHGIFDLDVINDFDNFQLLPASENLKKSDKCDKNKFYEYLKNKGISYEY